MDFVTQEWEMLNAEDSGVFVYEAVLWLALLAASWKRESFHTQFSSQPIILGTFVTVLKDVLFIRKSWRDKNALTVQSRGR